MNEREDFEEWCAKEYGPNAYLHTSATCGEWEAYQAGRAITAQALSGGAASTEVEAPPADFLAPDPYEQGRRDMEAELSAVLPGTTYMDPPDGGAPSILTQLQRQAADARRYLWLLDTWGFTITERLFGIAVNVNVREELDAAIDAALRGKD